MTLPRELQLDRDDHGYLLRSFPVVETEMLREDEFKLDIHPDRSRQNVGPLIGDAYPLYEIDLLFEFDAGVPEEIEFGIILENAVHEMVTFGYNSTTQEIFFDRNENSGRIDFSADFPGFHHAPYKASDKGEIRFHAFVDLSSIELFVDDGAVVMTELVFPNAGFETINYYRSHVSINLKEGTIYRLKSAW